MTPSVKLRVEDGSKLRVNTTVVETDIHHPTDNTLLWDVVRALTRLVGQLAEGWNCGALRVFATARVLRIGGVGDGELP